MYYIITGIRPRILGPASTTPAG